MIWNFTEEERRQLNEIEIVERRLEGIAIANRTTERAIQLADQTIAAINAAIERKQNKKY